MLKILLVLWIALSCPSCIFVTFTKKYGDAKFLDRKEILTWGVMMDEIRWPRMNFGQRGIHQFEVRKMSRAVFPNHLHLELPDGDRSGKWDPAYATVWKQCRIRLVYTTVAGEVFYDETLILGDREKVKLRNIDGFSVTFRILPAVTAQLSDLKDYNIQVEVLDPVVQPEGKREGARSIRFFLRTPRAYLITRGHFLGSEI